MRPTGCPPHGSIILPSGKRHQKETRSHVPRRDETGAKLTIDHLLPFGPVKQATASL